MSRSDCAYRLTWTSPKEYDYGWMRLSPHVYTSEADVDRALALIRKELA